VALTGLCLELLEMLLLCPNHLEQAVLKTAVSIHFECNFKSCPDSLGDPLRSPRSLKTTIREPSQIFSVVSKDNHQATCREG
jgi:hypothetical protein